VEKSWPVAQGEMAEGGRGVRRAEPVAKKITSAGVTAAQDLDRECVRKK